MLGVLKPWRFVAAIFLGFSLGFGCGVYMYANYLDQPEVVNQTEINQKQKIKVRNNTGVLETQPETEINNTTTKKKKRRKKDG